MSARAEMEALIKRLEEAREGSRELDAEIAFALGWWLTDEGHFSDWVNPTGERGPDVRPPDFTRSADAALSMVPEGWGVSIHMSPAEHNCSQSASLLRGEAPFFDAEEIEGIAATAIIALCIACLRARLAERKDEP